MLTGQCYRVTFQLFNTEQFRAQKLGIPMDLCCISCKRRKPYLLDDDGSLLGTNYSLLLDATCLKTYARFAISTSLDVAFLRSGPVVALSQ